LEEYKYNRASDSNYVDVVPSSPLSEMEEKLHQYCAQGRYESIVELVEEGVDINSRDANGCIFKTLS
jgi:ankyrin repeat protein